MEGTAETITGELDNQESRLIRLVHGVLLIILGVLETS